MSASRLEAIRGQMRRQGADCLALLPGPNMRYVTGISFQLLERPFVLFIPVDAEPVLVMPTLEAAAWNAHAPFPATKFLWDDGEGPDSAFVKAAAALPPIQTLAVEHLRMRVLEYTTLARCLPKTHTVAAEPILEPLRMIKSPEEISALRKAANIVELALAEVVSAVRPGMTEREIANRLTSSMLMHGAESVPIAPIVLSGPKSGMPHGTPHDRRVQPGEILLMDYVTTVEGYFADITRTFVVGGEPEPRFREVYEVVKAANQAGRAFVRPEVTCAEVDHVVRQVIEKAGYGPYFVHRTGHGLGLDVHEAPAISSDHKMPLKAGHVFTIEPGIYLDGWGGVRIEDDVLVTADGCESLTSFSRDLQVLGG